MFLLGGKMDNVAPLPPGWHRPGNLLCRIRQFISDGFSHILELIPDGFILGGDVLVYRLLSFPAVVGLAFILKGSAALWAFPHH